VLHLKFGQKRLLHIFSRLRGIPYDQNAMKKSDEINPELYQG